MAQIEQKARTLPALSSARFDADLNDRVVLRSPLGPPSAAAARFLGDDKPNYDNFVEPDESLAAWGRLVEAQQSADGGDA